MIIFVKKILKKIYFILKSKRIRINNKLFKYIYINKNSKISIIVFSAFASSKNSPKYNYYSHISKLDCNSLFILDNYGYEKRGSYYLANDFGDGFVKLFNYLYEKYINGTTPICIGTSKGGTASILFAKYFNAKYLIIGSPQYHIGEYLKRNELHISIANYILGNNLNESSFNKLNSLVDKALEEYHCYRMFLISSINEDSYAEISSLYKRMKDLNVKVDFIELDYENHNDIGIYYPDLAKEIINKIKENLND